MDKDLNDEFDEEFEKELDARERPKPIKSPIYEHEPSFRFSQKLGLLVVLGTLIIGTAAGSYALLEELMFTPCLGCLGLYPNIELEFGFDTVDGQPHPEFILEHLNKAGPIFIEFTQNDENCPPCARMRPKISELEDEYKDEILFIIININEDEMTKFYKGDKTVEPVDDDQENEYFHIYDRENIADGRMATPTFIIITIDADEDENIKPSFAVGYGEYKNDDAEQTKVDLANALDFSLRNYEHFKDDYKL